MFITFHQQVLPEEGEPVKFDCPACGAKAVSSVPGQTIDYVKIAYLIPLLKLRATTILCGNCDVQITCTAPLEQISGKDAAAIAPFIRYHPTPKAKIWSLIGLLTCLIPLVGLVTVGVAALIGRGTQGWTARLNVLTTILAVTSTILGGLLMFMPN